MAEPFKDLNAANERIIHLENELTAANKKAEDLETELTAAKQKVEDLEAKLKAKTEEVETAEELIEEIKAEATAARANATKERQKSDLPVVEHGGKQYQFTMPKFRMNRKVGGRERPAKDQVVEAAKAANNKDLIKFLVESGSVILKELTEAEEA